MENSSYPRSAINVLTILTTIMETILFFPEWDFIVTVL